jgi:hypothetical protein
MIHCWPTQTAPADCSENRQGQKAPAENDLT